MDELLEAITRQRATLAALIGVPTSGYKCVSGRHSWQTVFDASLCCAGTHFLRLAVAGERVAMVTSRVVKRAGKAVREIQKLAWQKLEDLPAGDPARAAMQAVIT